LIYARTLLAKVVRRKIHAIARHVTTDAIPPAVTDIASTTRQVLSLRRIRRRTIGTNIFRAGFVIIRQIGVVTDGHGQGVRHPAADDLFAISCILQYGTGERRLTLISDLARIVHTAALLAFRFDDIHAIIRNDAIHARTEARANVVASGHTERSFGNRRIDRRPRITQIRGAWIAVILDIGIVVQRRVDARDTRLNLAIAGNLRESRRGHTVEFRIRAGADCRIAELFGARIHIIAIRVGRTGYLAKVILAESRFRSLLAYRPVRQRGIHGTTIDTRIRRARIAVIRDIGRIFLFGSNPRRAKYGFTIRRRLKRIGSGNSIQH